METIDRINKVLEAFLLRDLQKVFENVPLRVRLSVDAKIENILEADKCLR